MTLNRIKVGDNSVKIPMQIFDIIRINLKALSESIHEDDVNKAYDILSEFAMIANLTTGNGNYMYKKKMFIIDGIDN